MPLFVIQCTDRPGSLQLRLDTRPAHLDYMNGLGDRLVVGGPFLGPAGQPNGSRSEARRVGKGGVRTGRALVTGVQTCALPISAEIYDSGLRPERWRA